ncbi:uncharacterized protein N7482_007273 [Penicillium canariense]|uniref:Sexual development protein n=1 Tax=Penicillium canariense TaxID=189055 RepID=A0A9W9HXV1_9EURO|nr:uncharacterized protein N7482_007273 [Penicillium canariense]KAJ5160269.1 hypothetical protein N7482_007273 [Penicillium canariense]
MRNLYLAGALVSLACFVTAAPTSLMRGQLPDGMPSPGPSELKQIEQSAHGTLPNGPPPPAISNQGIVNLKLIAFNELFEVAFFNELITNITENVEGYRFNKAEEQTVVLDALKAILAQEELHALRANDALSHFNVTEIEPCKYQFPVQDFDDAIVLASTFTSLVLGTLQDVVERFALGHDVDLAREISSVIGQEGEQQGWFRVMQGKIPSELPFLTTSDLNFAFTAIQDFVVPGSCPNIFDIPLRTFEDLKILSTPGPQSQNLTFQFNDPDNDAAHPLWMTYINQQNLPIVEPLHIISRDGREVQAEALFPFDDHEMNGLTIATVTNLEGPFEDVSSVAKWTLAGPGLIIIN